eukprot:3169108-Pyramimonas_sp.AAC.1
METRGSSCALDVFGLGCHAVPALRRSYQRDEGIGWVCQDFAWCLESYRRPVSDLSAMHRRFQVDAALPVRVPLQSTRI